MIVIAEDPNESGVGTGNSDCQQEETVDVEVSESPLPVMDSLKSLMEERDNIAVSLKSNLKTYSDKLLRASDVIAPGTDNHSLCNLLNSFSNVSGSAFNDALVKLMPEDKADEKSVELFVDIEKMKDAHDVLAAGTELSNVYNAYCKDDKRLKNVDYYYQKVTEIRESLDGHDGFLNSLEFDLGLLDAWGEDLKKYASIVYVLDVLKIAKNDIEDSHKDQAKNRISNLRNKLPGSIPFNIEGTLDNFDNYIYISDVVNRLRGIKNDIDNDATVKNKVSNLREWLGNNHPNNDPFNVGSIVDFFETYLSANGVVKQLNYAIRDTVSALYLSSEKKVDAIKANYDTNEICAVVRSLNQYLQIICELSNTDDYIQSRKYDSARKCINNMKGRNLSDFEKIIGCFDNYLSFLE